MIKEKILDEIAKELSEQGSKDSAVRWMSAVSVSEVKDNEVVIETPNKFTMDWIRHNYMDPIKRVVNPRKVKFQINPRIETINPDPSPTEEMPLNETKQPDSVLSQDRKPNSLNPKYVFDNFVVGPSNQFAYAASRAVAEKKSKNYNPLFIYGGVGLGKTHLLHAIGNAMLSKNPRLKIIAIQAESFMNEMILAIRTSKIDQFRNHYRRDCDVLLMDDIEILAGKERTQEEFFYTFNDLFSAGKKIVITSDKFPKEMVTLEERLRSRFESGIIVDIQPPEFETRIAILKFKAESDGIHIPDKVLMMLAERVKSNIRKLEGCLIRMSALASLSGAPITAEMAEDVIHAVSDDHEEQISPDTVMKLVASFYKIKVSDLKSPKRNRKYTVPRQIAMYICRELCSMSYPDIGQSFGGRDHSTVIHSCRKIGIDKNTDHELSRHLELIKKQLGSNQS